MQFAAYNSRLFPDGQLEEATEAGAESEGARIPVPMSIAGPQLLREPRRAR